LEIIFSRCAARHNIQRCQSGTCCPKWGIAGLMLVRGIFIVGFRFLGYLSCYFPGVCDIQLNISVAMLQER
jgi:hypothetical protein